MLDQNLRVINITNINNIVKIAPRASISITIDILSSFGLHLFISCLNGISNNIYFAVHLRSWLLSALHPVKYTFNISLTKNNYDLNNSGRFWVKRLSDVFLFWSNFLYTFFERHCDTDLPCIANIQTWWAGSCMTHIKKIQSSKLLAAFKENFLIKKTWWTFMMWRWKRNFFMNVCWQIKHLNSRTWHFLR